MIFVCFNDARNTNERGKLTPMIHSDNLTTEPRPDSGRIITPTPESKEEVLERALRPKHLDEYVGKKKYAARWTFNEAERLPVKLQG